MFVRIGSGIRRSGMRAGAAALLLLTLAPQAGYGQAPAAPAARNPMLAKLPRP